MNRIFVKRVGLVALLVGAAGLAAATPSEARPSRPRARGFQLFSASTLGMEVNRAYCGLRAIGETCVDITGSPVLGGGSWPRGSGDAYIFNSGLQIAGIIPASAGFAWAGDTVGTWFMDPRGDQQSGEQLTDIFSSLDAGDLAAWPSAATIRDTALYNIALIGRQTIAQQDIWWRYWDGNPNQTAGRGHPAGIMVEQRGLGWNFPSGNEDMIYFIYRFINITSSDPSKYAGLSAAGYTAAEIADIAAVGARFQQLNESKFGVAIPDTGYSITNTFAAFFMDPDVGDFLTNYSTAFLPFAMSAAYVGDWDEPNWQFPSSIFSPPFAVAPGFVGVKYLKSPRNPSTGQEFGISMFSNTSNGAPFPDAVGIEQMYRYLSGTVSPALGDNSCTVTNAQQRRLCALVQQQTDTRFLMSSGPFQLDPGKSSVIVVAYLFAAPLAAPVGPFIGGNLPPGIPPSGTRLLLPAADPNRDTLRVVDRIAGWVSHADANADANITQNEVTVVDRSLLAKSLVAQAVFNNRFLLPFAPEAPDFYAVPGDNQVTVVWRPSVSETAGDPYFAVASVQTLPPSQGGGPNPLYDPNYRLIDVEGYRVWRGRTSSQMEVIAQFDYESTSFVDVSGTVVNTSYGSQCAPELGLITSCPTFPNPVPIATQTGVQPGLVQIPPGGRVVAGGNAVITQADTAVSGGVKCGGDPCPNLTDTGVPFAFVDNTARNGFRYFYAVTAFDVNGVKSTGVGNTSLESPLVLRAVTPRAPSGQEVVGTLAPPVFIGANGNPVPAIPMPTLDPATGIFSGPMPQADVNLGFAAFVPQIVTDGALNLTVDSVLPFAHQAEGFVTARYFVTVQGSGAPTQMVLDVSPDYYDHAGSIARPFSATPASTSQSQRFGGDSTYSLFGSLAFDHPGPWRLTSWGRASINGAPGNSDFNGPRWWSGAANENTTNPNGGHCVGSPGACGNTVPVPNVNRSAGALPNVTTLFHVQSYNTVPNAPGRNIEAVAATVTRAADFRVVWGASGAIDSVVDVTHGIPVPFRTKLRASWGILNDSSFLLPVTTGSADGNNNLLTWSDIACVDPVPALINQCAGSVATRAVFQNRARLSPIAAAPASYANTATQTATGNGFIFYLNGHFFLMQMAALPAAGTVWNARFYAGTITGTAAAGDYAFTAEPRPPAAPGMRVQIAYTGSSFDPSTTTAAALARVHTVPDPYYVTNALELSATTKILRFVNLPSQAIIRIYSASGVLVNIVSHNDATGGGEATWNLRNRNNQFVASGVYFYHVETPDGREKIGRFTVVNFAQ